MQVSNPPTGFRHWGHNQVLHGSNWIVKIQRSRHPLLDFYFQLWTFLGDKEFYVALVPCFFWIPDADPKFGRLFTLLITLVIYVGNFLKEIFKLPRPPSPPVWRSKEEHDFGLPSIHTMVSYTMITYFLTYLHINKLYTVTWYHIIIAMGWIVQVALSRLYLGVHSPLDLAGGISVGSLLLSFWLKYGETVDHFLMNYIHVELFVFGIFVLLSSLHPRSEHTPSYSRAMVMLGLATGLVLGCHVRYAHHDYHLWVGKYLFKTLEGPLSLLRDTRYWGNIGLYAKRVLIRLTIGFTIMNFLYLIWYNLVFFSLRLLFGLPGIRHLLVGLNHIFPRLTFPSYKPVYETKRKESKKSRSVKHLPADPITWAKTSAAVAIAVVVSQTVPALFTIIDEKFFL